MRDVDPVNFVLEITLFDLQSTFIKLLYFIEADVGSAGFSPLRVIMFIVWV